MKPLCSKNEHDRLPHPPVRARRYDTAVKGELTNSAIVRYALEGRYGEEFKRRAEKVKKKKATRAKVKAVTQTLVNDILDGLL